LLALALALRLPPKPQPALRPLPRLTPQQQAWLADFARMPERQSP
jgi:hypothetical protein